MKKEEKNKLDKAIDRALEIHAFYNLAKKYGFCYPKKK